MSHTHRPASAQAVADFIHVVKDVIPSSVAYIADRAGFPADQRDRLEATYKQYVAPLLDVRMLRSRFGNVTQLRALLLGAIANAERRNPTALINLAELKTFLSEPLYNSFWKPSTEARWSHQLANLQSTVTGLPTHVRTNPSLLNSGLAQFALDYATKTPPPTDLPF